MYRNKWQLPGGNMFFFNQGLRCFLLLRLLFLLSKLWLWSLGLHGMSEWLAIGDMVLSWRSWLQDLPAPLVVLPIMLVILALSIGIRTPWLVGISVHQGVFSFHQEVSNTLCHGKKRAFHDCCHKKAKKKPIVQFIMKAWSNSNNILFSLSPLAGFKQTFQ